MNKRPDFVALDPIARKISEYLILVDSTRIPEVSQELQNSVIADAHHAGSSIDRISFY
jgi:hypothetical protein